MDKSETHVKVQKNGNEGWLHKTTWKRIGEHNNKEGWVLVPNEPAEVLAVREKKANPVAEQLSHEESVIVEKSEPFDPAGEIKQLSTKKADKKAGKKK